MNKIKKNFTDIFRNIWFGVKISFSASKFYFSLKCLILFSTTVIPLMTMWLWKEILNGILQVTIQKNLLIIFLFVYLILKLLIYILARFDTYVNTRYNDELTFYIENVMIEKTSRMDLSFFDSASMGDKVRHARSNFNIMNNMTWLIFNIISEVINIIATFIIIVSFNVWIGVITVILLVPYMLYNKHYTEYRLKIKKEQIRDNRKMDYYNKVFFDNNIQFEIKLNNIGYFFINRYNEIWQNLYKFNRRIDIKHNMTSIIIMILNVLSELITLVVSAFKVVEGKIGIGDLQYNINIVNRLRNQSSALMSDINTFLINNTRLNELQEFIAIQPEIEKSGDKIPEESPKIEFCDVTFRYPNSDKYVLKNCSFVIEPHEKIGLIGLNGAGKSTIIKLMFRFYDPEEGCIKLDGVDIKEYDVYKVRKVFGVLFQDYVTYCLPLREVIALSDFEKRYCDETLKNACDISGVTDITKDWEQGFDSIIGRYYADNGKYLSGGQWQLVGLARAYFKKSEFTILDEPSASLDPIYEDKIFEQLYHLSEGKSSITISHRLSNTTLADKILVIDEGHIIEQGSHTELLMMNGKYSYLFKLQAIKYV